MVRNVLLLGALLPLLASCAGVRTAPAPEDHPFRESWRRMPPDEIVSRSRYQTLRATAEIEVGTASDSVTVDGIIYGDESGRFRIRIYRFGIVSADVLYTGGTAVGIPDSPEYASLARLLPRLRPLLFWWTRRTPSSRVEPDETGPVFTFSDGAVALDGGTLAPRSQVLFSESDNGTILATYGTYRAFGERWLPTEIVVSGPGFTTGISVRSARLDVSLEPDVFVPPGTGNN